jgi:hypothetical protein
MSNSITPSDKGNSAGRASFDLVIRDTPRTPCDLCLMITGVDDPDAPPFLVSLYSETPGLAYRGLPLGKLSPDISNKTLPEYLKQIYDAQFERLRSLPDPNSEEAYRGWEDQFNAELDGLGRNIWKWLPDRFHQIYSKLYGSDAGIRSILISSSEMIIPWELIIPQGEGAVRPFGRSHILGRWKPGLPMKPEPQRRRVKRFCVINPQYPAPNDLPATWQEAQEIKQLFPKAEIISPANFSTVRKNVLDQNDVHIFHFSGHGEYREGNADLSTLRLLAGESISALSLSGAAGFSVGSPLMYLNACHAGKTALVVGHMGGFSASCLDNGCCGVIAPYWPVEDDRARQFALALYKRLLLDRSIGEALQELREENPADITFRAFAFFGDPWTRLDLSAVS